ncbi:MAG: glycosyltransferase involved in cell wall biosynthesis [Polaribacter sp.]|jgi:glycosyltransferase involved in cell wall biosynthesis
MFGCCAPRAMNIYPIKTETNFTALGAFWHKDSPELLERALYSVCQNSLLPQEIVLIQDGAVSPELLKVVEDYNFIVPIRLIQLNDNMGLGHAMNVGLKAVKTPYVIRFDADDLSLSNRFEVLMTKLSEGYDLVGSQVCELNGSSSPKTIRRVPKARKEIARYLRYRNPFNHMTVGFRCDAVINMGGYPNIKLREDYALWARFLASDYKICNVDEVLVEASAGDKMILRRGGLSNLLAELKLQWLMVKLHVQSPIKAVLLGCIRSLGCTLPVFVRKPVYRMYLRDQLR